MGAEGFALLFARLKFKPLGFGCFINIGISSNLLFTSLDELEALV